MRIERPKTRTALWHHGRKYWVFALCAAMLAFSGCLPRGPISVNWPWRHVEASCDDDGIAVSAPHSMFNPVPTRPVFTPWLCDDAPHGSAGTIAANRPSEKSLDKPEERPHDSELADRRPAVRAASARSASTDAEHSAASSSSAAAEEYYNPSTESGSGNAAASNGQPTDQWHAGNSASQ